MPIVDDFTVKHDGRGFEFRVYVNTGEDPLEITRRLQKAARGQEKNACLVTAAKLSPEEVAKFLELCAEMAKSPHAQTFPGDV